MKTWSRLQTLAAGGVALAVIAGACSSGTATDTFAGTMPSAATPTAVAVQEPEPEAPVETQVPTETPAPDPAGDGADTIQVSIDRINATSVVPAGWEQTLGGGFESDSGTLEFDAAPAGELPDLVELGFDPIDQRVAGDRTWDLYSLDLGEVLVYIAGAEVGDLVYVIALEVTGKLAEDALESVLFPAIDAFEAGELSQQSITLAGSPASDADLQVLVDQVVDESDLPALGVTVFDGDGILESAVSGVRREGDPTPVEPDDRFSIGSNAKAMTATLVATFVDEGLISWDTTVADIYGDVLADLDDTMGQVTIRQLLTHTAGLDDAAAGLDRYIFEGREDERPLIDQRAEIARMALTRPPQHAAGLHVYSNIGYATVGALLEKLTGTPFEELLQTRIFDALGMDGCGFFAPGTPGQLDQPWGHLDYRAGEPVDPGGPDAELSRFASPAGLVHCSMADWTRFLQSQLRGFQGSETEIVSVEAFEALRTPAPGTEYAQGWAVLVQPDGSSVLTHTGSNLRFSAQVWLAPEDGRGFLSVTNLGVDLAVGPLGYVAEAVFARYASDPGTPS